MSNRLVHEDSPYLQQHKNNPFDWYPWCDDAFARAKHENKPLFISIGYSSCHWCHVMEHEVFENTSIAEFVNRHFICIKVDKEERPDIDKHFQELHSLLNRRSGGWPLSIFCTPENKPFYAATYIPPYTRDRMMGFSELATIIAQKVAQRDPKLFQNADEILAFMQPDTRPTQATHLNGSIMVQFDKQADHNFDLIHGGFSKSPKFPHASTLETLMTLHALDPQAPRHTLITRTLNEMAKGGMYDLIDGGFCRYSTDEAWLVPHFEKMTYDNGLLCGVYAKAYAIFEDPLYRRCAEEIADFMTQKMMEDHLFYSASDADTQGKEGKYFVYTYDEVLDALKTAGVTDIQGALARLDLSPQGNFEGECIITLTSLDRPEWFEPFAQTCRHLRSLRPYPFIDRKVNTAWNAMMINALFLLGKHTHHYEIHAIASLNALLSTMWIDDTLYHTTLIHKTPKTEAFLEDYAYLSATLIQAYQSTLDETYLIQAQQLANKALERFYDNGVWYFSRGSFATIAELDDGSYPSAMAVMVDVLLSLGSLVEGKYRHFAFKSLEYVSLKLMKTPIYYPKLTQQTLRYLKGDRIIKAHRTALLQCRVFTYPFVLLKVDERADGFLICGEHSCFASTPHYDELNTIVESTLQTSSG